MKERSRVADLTDEQYRSLAEFRYQLRCFLRFTERNALEAGLEPRQYQALLALRGLPRGEEATVGFLARRLLLAHHSAGAMADRLERKGWVRRRRSREDRRKVLLVLTARGLAVLRELATASRGMLQTSAPALVNALRAIRTRQRRTVAWWPSPAACKSA